MSRFFMVHCVHIIRFAHFTARLSIAVIGSLLSESLLYFSMSEGSAMFIVDDARYFPTVMSRRPATRTQLTYGMVIWWLPVVSDLTFDLCALCTCLTCV